MSADVPADASGGRCERTGKALDLFMMLVVCAEEMGTDFEEAPAPRR